MDKYAQVSTEIMAILGDFTPLVEPVSVDEAFLDLTGTATLWGPPPEAVRRIKSRIRDGDRTDGLGRPGGEQVRGQGGVRSAQAGRARRGRAGRRGGGVSRRRCRSSGSGAWARSTAKELEALGVTTIGQLQRVAPAVPDRALGAARPDLLDLAFGRDDRPVEPFVAAQVDRRRGDLRRATAATSRVLEATLRGQAERVAPRAARGEAARRAASRSSCASPTSGR